MKKIKFCRDLLFYEWRLKILQVTWICFLTIISGCIPEYTVEQNKLAQQEESNTPKQQEKSNTATTNPIHTEIGEASWYGPGFHGKKTATGEIFDQTKMTAAHPSLPMGTKAEVTNLNNDKKIKVRINDRGPYIENRVIDVSRAAAKKLDMEKDGIAQVKIEAKLTEKKNSTDRPNKTK